VVEDAPDGRGGFSDFDIDGGDERKLGEHGLSDASGERFEKAAGLLAGEFLHEGKDGGVIDGRGEVVVAHLVAFREAAGEVDEETLAEAALFIEDAVAAVDGDVDQFDFDHRGKG